MRLEDCDTLDWQKVGGLIPAVVQHAVNGRVLMLGFMNQDALQATIDTNCVTFYSRTKQALWTKGETSGNVLDLVSISVDCDRDTLLVLVNPRGPTCHKLTETCFDNTLEPMFDTLARLSERIATRASTSADASYTASLLASPIKRIAQKVGEEGVEVAIAGISETDDALCQESADLLYHLLVLLEKRGKSLEDVLTVLQARFSENNQ